MKVNITINRYLLVMFSLFSFPAVEAAVGMDRTRVIYNGSERSISVNINNAHKQHPYLAQSWLEDKNGNKIKSPFIALPPMQRIEPGARSLVKVQGLPAMTSLPQDRETLFYFNMREIPPKSSKSNSLQIALQTRVKMFYRPSAITAGINENWTSNIKILLQNDQVVIDNPTPYFVTFTAAASSKGAAVMKDFHTVMVAPKTQEKTNLKANQLQKNPELTYINDYGGRVPLIFTCGSKDCVVQEK